MYPNPILLSIKIKVKNNTIIQKLYFLQKAKYKDNFLVVLYVELLDIWTFHFPFVEFGKGVKISNVLLVLFGSDFDDWGDKLLNDRVTDHVWPKIMQKIDDKAFDVRAVNILICHDHQFPVAQAVQIFVLIVLSLEIESHR